MKTLTLNLKTEFYLAIRDGTKRVEYRDNSAWMRSRLWNYKTDEPYEIGDVVFLRGYTPDPKYPPLRFKVMEIKLTDDDETIEIHFS